MSIGTAKYGMPAPFTQPAAVAPGVSNGAVASATTPRWVENPAVWAVGITAVMLGLIGASTSARLGPVRASISAGKS